MATPVFCCGFECGVLGHLTASGSPTAPSFNTTTFRSGLRAGQFNVTASTSFMRAEHSATNQLRVIVRLYVRFVSLPSASCTLTNVTGSASASGPNLRFNQSDSKLYAAVDTTLGASGVSVTTGVWYCVDIDHNISVAGNDTCDVKVDGVACGQASAAGTAAGSTALFFGVLDTCTANVLIEDLLISVTSADYPLGAGYVLSYIPNADGTHNVAGAADFKHGTGTTPAGTDITNATTTAWQDIDKRPLVTSAAGAETLINMIAPPNATDYVEIQFEDSVEAAAPRAVEVIIGINQAATGNGNMEVRLNDNGTMGTIYTATGVPGVAIATGVVFKREHFADPPSAASVWVLGGAGNGDFNDLRIRFGSPAAVDANPDQYLVEVMFEAEYAEIFSATRKPVNINQAVARLSLR